MITLKNLKAKRPGDKLLEKFMKDIDKNKFRAQVERNPEIYDARTRDDYKLKQDYQEDYTIDNQNKGVETLNETITNHE